MCVHAAQLLAQFCRKLLHLRRILLSKIAALADVLRNVEQFLATGGVIVYQFPVAATYGAVQIDARSVAVPHVREVPDKASVGYAAVRFALQRGHDADAVDCLRHVILLHARHVEYSGVEVLYYYAACVACAWLYGVAPFHDERHTYAALVERSLSAEQRRVLREWFALAELRTARQSAVVAEEDDDGVLRLAVALQPVHYVAQTLVHALHQRGVSSVLVRKTLAHVLREEAHVLVDRNVHGVVRHIEIERLFVLLRLFECAYRLLRQCFGEEGARSPILLQSGSRHTRVGLAVAVVSVVAFAQIRSHSARRRARYVHVETEVARVFARRVLRSPMRLAAMYGVIAAVFQYLHERLRHGGVVQGVHLRYAVVVPVGQRHHVALMVGGLVALQRPVRHTVARHVHACHQAASRRRTDRAGIRLREHHSLACQSLHVRCLVHVVISCSAVPERHGCVLPSHVVHEKHEYVGALLLFGVRRSAAQCCGSREYSSLFQIHSDLFFNN